MDEISRQERIEAMRRRKAARQKRLAITKILFTCIIVVAIALTCAIVKHSSDLKKVDPEASAIITAAQENTSASVVKPEPITAATTTEKPSETTTSLLGEQTTVTVGEYVVESYDSTMFTTEEVNMRSVPDTTGEILVEIKGNEAVKVTGICSNNWYRIDYNGKTGYCSSKYLSATKAVKSGSYLLKVNRTQNIVTVYVQDENGEYTIPERAMVCSVGLDGKTPTGTFSTTDKYTWRLLSGNVYGQYATRITGHILFHSVPYYTQNKDDLESAEYNKLGQAASLGCVRLCVRDAKWIYDNCKSGTTVVIYDSYSPEPITPPSPIRIDLSDSRKGWDPTDPDSRNPW